MPNLPEPLYARSAVTPFYHIYMVCHFATLFGLAFYALAMTVGVPNVNNIYWLKPLDTPFFTTYQHWRFLALLVCTLSFRVLAAMTVTLKRSRLKIQWDYDQ